MSVTDESASRQRLYAWIDWTNTRSVLDIGCGSGLDLCEMGRLALPDARLIGVDCMEKSIATARSQTQDDPRFTFLETDVSRTLPFEEASFDAIFCKDTLECIPDKNTFLQEVTRVLRPRGQVVFAHWDWDSQLIDGEDKALIRKIVHAFADWKQDWMAVCDGWMGRRLWRTFQQSALFEGEIQSYVLTNTQYAPRQFGWERIHDFQALVRRGFIPKHEYDSFLASIERLAAHGTYFYSITSYVFVGRKKL